MVKKKRKVQRKNNSSNPRKFFKDIGISFVCKEREETYLPKFIKRVKERCGKKVAKELANIMDFDSAHNTNNHWEFCHSSLKLAKLWCGTELDRICAIADELKKLPPLLGSQILDIGGGPGHLAFWMANIWQDCKITVADFYSDIGKEWAAELNQTRVHFVEDSLPDLKKIQNQQFDKIVLSRVLSFIDDVALPHGIDDVDTENYFYNGDGKFLLEKLEEIALRIKQLLSPDGVVIVVESWSDCRILAIGQAFERVGLFIDPKRFNIDSVSNNFAVIAFSNSSQLGSIINLPQSMSVVYDIGGGDKGYPIYGMLGELLRKIIGDENLVMRLEYDDLNEGITTRNEILAYEGMAVYYKTTSGPQGGKAATIHSAIKIPWLLHRVANLEERANKDRNFKITDKFPE